MARARIYRHDVRCRDATAPNWMSKGGHAHGQQMHKRGECKKNQVADAEKPYFPEHAKLQVDQMRIEGAIISAEAACSRRERCIGERLGKEGCGCAK